MKTTTRNDDIQGLTKILKKQSHHTHDMVVPSDRIEMTDDGYFKIHGAPIPDDLAESIGADTDGTATLPYRALNLFHKQLASKLPLPAFKRTYDHLREDEPALAAEVVNTYLQKDERRFLVRTLRPEDEDGQRGKMRALLSDSYRIINNYDVLLSAAGAVKDAGLKPDVRTNLTQGSMWAEFTFRDHPVDVGGLFDEYDPKGGRTDGPHGRGGIAPGFVIRNSEVGQGAFEIRPRAEIIKCRNGITRKEDALRKIHVGQTMDSGLVTFSEEVTRKQRKLAMQQVREAVEHFATEDFVEDLIKDVFDVDEDPTETLDNPVQTVRNARSELGIPEEKEEQILDYFVDGGDTRRVAVPNALTEWAQEQPDADLQYEVEGRSWGLLSQMDELDVAPAQN